MWAADIGRPSTFNLQFQQLATRIRVASELPYNPA
jgi:hypothetical protein